jgi:hypothetical protein
VVVARYKSATPPDQKIKVDALVSLQHMVDIQLPVAAV